MSTTVPGSASRRWRSWKRCARRSARVAPRLPSPLRIPGERGIPSGCSPGAPLFLALAAQRINLAIVAKTALPRRLAYAKQRGWRRLQRCLCRTRPGPASCGEMVGGSRCVASGSADLGSSDARAGRLARLGGARRSGQQSAQPDRPGIWFRGSRPVPRGSTSGGRGSAGVRTRSARPGLPGGW